LSPITAAQKAGEERRRKQEVEAREKAEKQAIKAYIDGLTPQELEALDQAARAEADPEILAQEIPSLAKAFRIMRRDPYVRRLLEAEGKLIPAEG
jgi:hypothetical protein